MYCLLPKSTSYAIQGPGHGGIGVFLGEQLQLGRRRGQPVQGQPNPAQADAALPRTLQCRLGQSEEGAAALDQIHLISFNPAALEHMAAALQEALGGSLEPSCGLHLILTTNRPLYVFLTRLLPWRLPLIDEAAIQDTLSGAPWLTGTLLEPRFVKRFPALANGINRIREARGLDPLEVALATYYLDYEDWVQTVTCETEASGERLQHLTTLAYQVSRD